MDGSLPPARPSTLLIRSVSREHGFEPLRIEGKIPDRLRGTLYRIGPGLLDSVGVPVTHLFEADGAVSAIKIGADGAEGAIRVIESEGLKQERAAGRPLSGFRAPYSTRIASMFNKNRKNVANTAPMVWQDRLFAMVESDRPTELDPETLGTIGETNLDGVVKRAFSAHPHRVASRNAQYNFGVRYGRDTMLDVFELPDVGPARRMTSIRLERAVMMHDFIATDRRLVFFVAPLEVNLPRAIFQVGPFGKLFDYHPEHGVEIITVSIDDPQQVRRFKVDSFFQWHFANAFESGDGIEVDFCRYPDASSLHRIGDGTAIGGDLVRVRIEDASESVRTVLCTEGLFDFPVIDTRIGGSRHRYVFTNAETETTRGVARHDLETGEIARFTEPTSTWYGEPVYVPDPQGGEGEGWLLVMVLDARVARSQLSVFDATRVSDGPVAKLVFPETLPISFHGVFRPS